MGRKIDSVNWKEPKTTQYISQGRINDMSFDTRARYDANIGKRRAVTPLTSVPSIVS